MLLGAPKASQTEVPQRFLSTWTYFKHPFFEVEKNRVSYHSNPLKNTVHRTSLLAPRVEGCDTLISFLNHFLIKRKIESVGMKVSAYNKHQVPLSSYWEDIKEARVYRFNLDKMFNSVEATTYQIEFFSSKNLYIIGR